MAERKHPWQPDWALPPAPAGDDEQAVIAFRAVSLREIPQGRVVPWASLDEWQREAWRREYRDEENHRIEQETAVFFHGDEQ